MSADQRPLQSVLFACSHNAIRSPMAEAMLKRLTQGRLYIRSCGVRPEAVHPIAREVMAEVGLDIARHGPQSFDDVRHDSFDLVVSLSPEAHRLVLEETRTSDFEAVYWPTFDPTAGVERREQLLEAFRVLRDQLSKRLQTRFADYST